jgi:hypothetical protein
MGTADRPLFALRTRLGTRKNSMDDEDAVTLTLTQDEALVLHKILEVVLGGDEPSDPMLLRNKKRASDPAPSSRQR